jgi:F-type H+-transporting ATPase subunit a
LKKFFNFKNPILFFVGILEGISEITRIFSLAVRLFGNLFAGEILLIIISYLFSFLLPLPFLGLEIFVSFIQALIFSSLVIIFYATHTEKSE